MSHADQRLTLDGYQERVADRLRAWQRDGFARRLWDKDPTLWASDPVPELTDRLGWLRLPETMRGQLDDLTAFAAEVKAAGVRHVVLLGMGGSSLAPEVFQRTFGSAPGHPAVIVLDSTHPAAVRAVESQVDLRHTFFLVSSKSGTTTETLSLFRYFWQRVALASGTPGDHFAAITDPGTPLERVARERGFRRVFLAPPDVGGRFSALTVFGLVPAALIGLDVRRILDRAWTMAETSGPRVAAPDNPGLALGAAMGELARAGRDKLTLFASPSLAALLSWIEQLIAESTGKNGTGLVPVVDEPPASPEVYGADRFFASLRLEGDDAGELGRLVDALEARGHPVVQISLTEKADVGREFFRWEVAVAAAGAVLGIHPFNQPDVQLAKDLAGQAMQQGHGRGGPQALEGIADVSAARPEALAPPLRAWMAEVRLGDYLGLHAYLAPTDRTSATLTEMRRVLRDRLRVATTSGYGPRFLHSTGQLHKGGPNTGLFLQLVDDPEDDLAVPETNCTFGALIRAQAVGDIMALQQQGRRLLRVNLGRDVAGGLAHIVEVLRG